MDRSYWPTSVWKSISAETAGMSSEKLSLLNNIIPSQYQNINGIMIVRNGYVVYERYFRRKSAANIHNMASVTKSVISALVGIAIDKGYIKSIDEPVIKFFPEYEHVVDNGTQGITIRHLLTMTAPYAFKKWYEPLDRMRKQPDWVRFILTMLGRQGRIGTFKYSSFGTHLLSAILTRTTGASAREFANTHLFSQIGMREIPDHVMTSYDLQYTFGNGVKGWTHDHQGYSTGGWGLTLSLQDMARFGYLYLNNGEWDGKQVIPKEWITDSIQITDNDKRKSLSPYTILGHRYGYLWWLNGSDPFIFSALGHGGSAICCIPEKDIVIAIASQLINRPRDRGLLIDKYILSAITD